MKRSTLELAAVFSAILVVSIIGFLGYRLIQQNVPLSEYLMKDYYLYQKNLFYAFPVFEYYVRYFLFHGFYNLIRANYTLNSCVPYHMRPYKPFELLSYKDSVFLAEYFFGIPFVPLTGTNNCFNLYITHHKNELINNLVLFKELQHDSDIDISTMKVQPNPLKLYINLSWMYDYKSDSHNYEHKILIENNYNYKLDALAYDVNLSETYCNVSKLFDFYKVKNPNDFMKKYSRLKKMCTKIKISQKYINCTINFSRIIPYFVAYNISSNFNFTATLRYWCERFGGIYNARVKDCILPRVYGKSFGKLVNETKYYECFNDFNTKVVSSFSDIDIPIYTYWFLSIEKVLPNGKNTVTLYYPITEDYITSTWDKFDIKYNKKKIKQHISKIDHYLSELAIRYFVYYGKKYIFTKFVCKVGYSWRLSPCTSNPTQWISHNIDGFYKIHPYYDSSYSCSNPDCCAYSYYSCDHHTCCTCVGWHVHYLQRVKSIKSFQHYFTLETFGCFEN